MLLFLFPKIVKSLEFPRSLKVVVGLLSTLFVAALLMSLFREEEITIMKIIGSLCILIICAAYNYALSVTKLTLDEQQMTHYTLTGSTIYKWDEMDDVDQTPHFTFISVASQRKQLTLCRGEYGLSLQPFEELGRAIANTVLPRLYQRWDQLMLPLTFAYPRFHWTTILAYLIPLFLVLTFFALFVVPAEGMVAEKIAFIAYNIGVYESVQKFGGLITSGKITNGIDVSKVAELLSQSTAFYDAYMIAGLINAMLYDTKDKTVERVSPEHVRYVMSQLKATGVSLP